MATYAIGDVQGCFASLQALVAQLAFDPRRDRLLFLGDIVNRGPESLAVLRYVRGLGAAADTVLGNHDIHLLARAAGVAAKKSRDTLKKILTAPDCDELMDWLARRPLTMRHAGSLLVHAGLLPSWRIEDAEGLARCLEQELGDPRRRREFLANRRANRALRALTTLRTCHVQDGSPCDFDGAPVEAPIGCVPWFKHPQRQSRGTTVLFGHWSALGVAQGDDYIGLDSGCIWGRQLTAYHFEEQRFIAVPAQEKL